MKTDKSRRNFIVRSAMTAGGMVGLGHAAVPFPGSILDSNEKIRMGFIGVGNRGSQLLGWFMENPHVEVVALCDVYDPYLQRERKAVDKRYLDTGKVPEMNERLGRRVKRYSDFRALLDQKDIDAVCIATPDHWHAVQTIQAFAAGKHVYVEKPLTITIAEGRKMLDAHKRHNKVCAVGLNRRGSSIYRHLVKEVQGGRIGEVTSARALRISNMYPDGIGRLRPEAPPNGFDWEMWLGPRPYRPYQYNIAPYFFRWWKEYSTQMGNWGVHYMDVIRWMMGEEAPVAISASGGKYAVDDDRNIPDTMEVLFEMPGGSIIKFSIHEASGGGGIKGGEVELHGTKGTLVAGRQDYTITPSGSGQFQTWSRLTEPEHKSLEESPEFGHLGGSENPTSNLINNFIDCVRTGGEPMCTLEEGHRSTCFAHLANIALETGMRIEWDPANERILHNSEANKLLHYEYREPWMI